ncbi:hypothetical protein XarbCFBP7604_09935 [Xanthomonas arboricola]|uniref:hypothetical protein n=1 Tax=Xanthomonas arboricola TaxID=56448 RepID=UPI000CEE1A50|nr:hypothetical protein [Xanthomonas arboricola]PPU34156.1 hypothetical protein XarbCFBP7604_09935 [Xanthomonas arboricola]
MRERPIRLKAHEVRAILSGAKSQTRHAVKLPHENPLGQWEASTSGGYGARDRKGNLVSEHACIWHTRTGDTLSCPFGDVGDRLWVREKWADLTATHGRHWEKQNPVTGLYERGIHPFLWYAADGDQPEMGGGEINREPWRPSTSMPRSACRVVLEITEVRVERLHAISAADAEAEGLRKFPFEDSHAWAWRDGDRCGHASPTGAFRSLWTSTGGDWEANPWVWAISFRRLP